MSPDVGSMGSTSCVVGNDDVDQLTCLPQIQTVQTGGGGVAEGQPVRRNAEGPTAIRRQLSALPAIVRKPMPEGPPDQDADSLTIQPQSGRE